LLTYPAVLSPHFRIYNEFFFEILTIEVKKEMPNDFALPRHTPHQQALGQAINNINVK
jgi:hypothetical protein